MADEDEVVEEVEEGTHFPMNIDTFKSDKGKGGKEMNVIRDKSGDRDRDREGGQDSRSNIGRGIIKNNTNWKERDRERDRDRNRERDRENERERERNRGEDTSLSPTPSIYASPYSPLLSPHQPSSTYSPVSVQTERNHYGGV